ncbi:glycosyltransferase [Pedobacter deserti]|uniref:glycosyltransferase n=1 Tax=Pedobacter deserti TaxID=2817382 RepID=UPI00210F1A47|nr:glycosyltransferase [Pedobacter sp. SYSU D00382]
MVPRIIHQIVGKKPDNAIKRCLNSWKTLQKDGFKIIYWNDVDIQRFIGQSYLSALKPLLTARNHAEAADIARYAIVHFYGGHYLDWDVQLINRKKFLELNEVNCEGYLVQDQKNKTIASEAFSALPHEDYLSKVLENIINIYLHGFRDSLQTPWYSGPFRMREVYYSCDKWKSQNLVPLKDVFLYDYDEIRVMPPRPPEVAMIHYWMHSWIK